MRFVDLMVCNNSWGANTPLMIHKYEYGGFLPFSSTEVVYSQIPVDFYEAKVRWFNNNEVGIVIK